MKEVEYRLTFNEAEMVFFRELFESQMAIAVSAVEIVADVKRKIMAAKPIEPARPPE